MSQQGRLVDEETNFETITGNSGGPVSPDGTGTINVVGTGTILVTGNPGTNTQTISSIGGLVWNEVVGASASMSVNNGYISNNAGLVTLTLPVTVAVGEEVRITGKGAGGWLIAQNAGQSINFGALITTPGVGGSLASTLAFDSIELLCITANTQFVVLSSIGNIMVV